MAPALSAWALLLVVCCSVPSRVLGGGLGGYSLWANASDWSWCVAAGVILLRTLADSLQPTPRVEPLRFLFQRLAHVHGRQWHMSIREPVQRRPQPV